MTELLRTSQWLQRGPPLGGRRLLRSSILPLGGGPNVLINCHGPLLVANGLIYLHCARWRLFFIFLFFIFLFFIYLFLFIILLLYSCI